MNAALWYLTRASALVSLALLTTSLVLGMVTSGRSAPLAEGRFVRAALHRTLSLVMVVFVAAHVLTSVIETYVDIGWLSVLVPFSSSYDRFWVGLGTLSLDLLIAVTVTSILRQRISHRAWKLVHWTAYALWPIAAVHGIGASTADQPLVLGLVAGCGVAVLSAGVWRLRAVDLDRRQRKLADLQGWR